MEINIAQFLLEFTKNECYRVAGVVSCVFHKSPCVPVIRGDHVPVPIAKYIDTYITQRVREFGLRLLKWELRFIQIPDASASVESGPI
jgi:hypothetical protein